MCQTVTSVRSSPTEIAERIADSRSRMARTAVPFELSPAGCTSSDIRPGSTRRPARRPSGAAVSSRYARAASGSAALR